MKLTLFSLKALVLWLLVVMVLALPGCFYGERDEDRGGDRRDDRQEHHDEHHDEPHDDDHGGR